MPRLTIKVTPNAKQSEILGAVEIAGGERVLAVKLKAPPVDGKANEALISFLAGYFDVPKRAVTIVRGAKDRLKVVEIEGVPGNQLRELTE